MSIHIRKSLPLALLMAAAALLAACANNGAQATGAFQTEVAVRVQDTLAAAPTTAPAPASPQFTDTPVATPTATLAATEPPTPTPSPTARDVKSPTLGPYELSTVEVTPVTAVPSPVPRIKFEDDVKNILLIGSDQLDANGGYRSDTLIVVSVDKTANTVTMLSIPRDLYVFIPKSRAQMGRVNSVINVAKNVPGGPIPLLEQTILYNLGIPIHYYARVDFASFKAIVDTLGGVDIPVTCTFQDYRLKDPSLDPQLEDSWALFTLDAGWQHMDGDTALWYARSRQVTGGGDFDRARRQQEVLRAIYHTARAQNLLPQAPALYQQFQSTVETDMTLGDVLQFMSLALSLNDLNLRSYKISPPYVTGWTTPNDGASVQLPAPDEFYKYVQRVMSAGSTNRAAQTPYSVEIWNGTTWKDAGDLAAYRLGLEGLVVTHGQADSTEHATTTLIDYTTSPKGSPIAELKNILHLKDANVIALPDPYSPVQFRVILGADYNPCTYTVSPLATATP